MYSTTIEMIADELNIQEGQIIRGENTYYIYLGTTNGNITDFGILGSSTEFGTVHCRSFAAEQGTEADPYLISNGAELAYLAQIANTGGSGATLGKYYKQTNDIMK